MEPAKTTPSTPKIAEDRPLGHATVMIIGAGEPAGHQLAREAARRHPDQLFLVDADESRLSELASQVPSSAQLVIADPGDRDAMTALLERHRPDVVIYVTPPVDALVDGDRGHWPEGTGPDAGWLAVAATEAGCTRFTQVSKTSLFDSTSAPASGERHDPEASDASLRAALENERANAEHLRRLTPPPEGAAAPQARARRPGPRRAGPWPEHARSPCGAGALNRRVAKVSLIASAIPRRGDLAHRRVDLTSKIAQIRAV